MRTIFWSTILFLFWMMLTGNIELFNIFLGITMSISMALIYKKLLKHQANFQMPNIFWFTIYLFVLLKNLVLSNIHIAIRVLSKNMDLSPAIVSVETQLQSEWKKLLLANSITLTPGTLTLDIVDNKLYIHIISDKDIQNKEQITQEFEKVIAKL